MRWRILGLCALLGLTVAHGQNIPAPKLDLIKQAVSAMKLDVRIQGLVAQRVEARLQTIRLEYPEIQDSLLAEARGVIAGVYTANMETRDGLLSRVYSVLDRHLSAEDLKFATDFRSSDQGKRYRELVPRIVQESLTAGHDWAERLEPEIRRRLEERVRLK
jgi:hypothetical protein